MRNEHDNRANWEADEVVNRLDFAANAPAEPEAVADTKCAEKVARIKTQYDQVLESVKILAIMIREHLLIDHCVSPADLRSGSFAGAAEPLFQNLAGRVAREIEEVYFPEDERI